jgi:hypothetical protein
LAAVAARPVTDQTARLLPTVHGVDGDPVAFGELAEESRPIAWVPTRRGDRQIAGELGGERLPSSISSAS